MGKSVQQTVSTQNEFTMIRLHRVLARCRTLAHLCYTQREYSSFRSYSVIQFYNILLYVHIECVFARLCERISSPHRHHCGCDSSPIFSLRFLFHFNDYCIFHTALALEILSGIHISLPSFFFQYSERKEKIEFRGAKNQFIT